MSALGTLDKSRWTGIEKEQPTLSNPHFPSFFYFHWLCPRFSILANFDEQH
jgi:hypothetical protein